MAQVADILKLDDEKLQALAAGKGLAVEDYETREALAEALSSVVTPQEVAAVASASTETSATDDDEETEAEDTEDSTASEDGLVYVRLARGYPLQQPHTRAGITLSPGPEPVGFELTDEQVALLDSDRYVEIVDGEEVAKWREHHAAINGTSEVAPDPTHQRPISATYDDVNTPVAQTPGRRYDSGINGGSNGDESNPDGSIQVARQTKETPAAKTETPGSDTATLDYKELQTIATSLGIEKVVGVKKDVLKIAIETAQGGDVEGANAVVADSLKK